MSIHTDITIERSGVKKYTLLITKEDFVVDYVRNDESTIEIDLDEDELRSLKDEILALENP